MNAAPYATSPRVCAKTGLALPPGAGYVGVLVEDGLRIVRRDVALGAWDGEPPANAIAHWRGVVPKRGKPAKPVMDEAILFDCFDRLAGAIEPAKQNFRYVVALLLLRKKKLKFEDSRRSDGVDVLFVRDTRTGKRAEVIDPQLTEADMDDVQAEVFQVLGWE